MPYEYWKSGTLCLLLSRTAPHINISARRLEIAKQIMFDKLFIHENLRSSLQIVNAILNGNIQFHDISLKEHKIDIFRFLTCKVIGCVLMRLELLTNHQNIFGIHEMSQAVTWPTTTQLLVTIDIIWENLWFNLSKTVMIMKVSTRFYCSGQDTWI